MIVRKREGKRKKIGRWGERAERKEEKTRRFLSHSFSLYLSQTLSLSLTSLPEDEVVGAEDGAKGARADRVHGSGLCFVLVFFRC